MYLQLYAVSDATIERVLADPPLVWRIVAADETKREADARAELHPRPGLLARLFGRGASEPPPPPPPLELAPGEGDLGPDGNFEKDWQGMHYLLTGSAWQGDPPLNFLLAGGREVDIEGGMAPIRAYTHAETRVIADALAAVEQRELRNRFDPARMMELEIYPEIWDRAEAGDQLLVSVDHLREAVSTVAGRGFGLLVFIA